MDFEVKHQVDFLGLVINNFTHIMHLTYRDENKRQKYTD